MLCLVEARFPAGTHETYQVPLGAAPGRGGLGPSAVILEADGWTVYDALADPAAGRELLHRDALELRVPGRPGRVHLPLGAEPRGAGLGGTVDVRPVGVEQSNSSIVFGDELIMKAFRKVEPGVNPELELLRFLTAHGFPHIASLAGWYEVEGRLIDATLGILQEFLLGFRDGWELALDELAQRPGRAARPARGARDRDRRAALRARLGQLATRPSRPTSRRSEALAILTADVDEQIERVFLDLPETDATAPIRGRGQDVREKLAALSHVNAGGKVIRTHGDLHLGQTMLGDRGWVVLDFEGEPARPLPERRLKRSPLRDVAGMLRSFSYATAGARLLRGVEAPDGWEELARERFLTGYHECRGQLPAAAWAAGHRAAPGGLRAREGRIRVALRAQQPARLGRDPGSRDRAAPGFGVDMSEADQLIARQHANPHSYLGAHPENGSVVVRTFRPAASKVEVVTADGTHASLECVHPGGVFEGHLKGAELPLAYQLEVDYGESGTITIDDPYRFLPTIGELDVHLLGEGRHEELWERLGAHVTEVDGVTGTAFAVWAPSARAVSVVGDFNYWDGRIHPMRTLGSSGHLGAVPARRRATARTTSTRSSRPDGEIRLKADPVAFADRDPAQDGLGRA